MASIVFFKRGYIMKNQVNTCTISASNPRIIASFLEKNCLEIQEHPADFALFEELNAMPVEDVVTLFDKLKTWSVERTMLTIKRDKGPYAIAYMNEEHLKVHKGTQSFLFSLVKNENNKYSSITIYISDL